MVEKPEKNYPERPINTVKDDTLERGRFVNRLCSALVNEKTKQATGICIGITGAWGSGKSSILNLLHQKILETHPDALVVRFDPWLVSGRENVLSQFFAEFIGTINSRPDLKKRLSSFTKKLTKYGAELAPIINLKFPGVGTALKGGMKFIEKALSRDESLHNQRRDILKLLRDINIPIVVLIDELDRIDDGEVKAVAQLVRAIADFPTVSYCLAYDSNRVIQALGDGRGTKDEIEERGRAYLEKIVQLQIPLPVTLDTEMRGFLTSALESLYSEDLLPEGWDKSQRFIELVEILTPDVIATPRDIKRLVGVFHVLVGMVRNEVDWVDLIAYSALLTKAPKTIEILRRNPDLVVEDPLSSATSLWRFSGKEIPIEDRLKEINPSKEGGAGVSKILGFVFPWLRVSDSSLPDVVDGLRYRRPLLTVLRMDIPPGNFSRKDIDKIIRSTRSEITQALKNLFIEDKLAGFIDRFDDIYKGIDDHRFSDFWLAVSDFFKQPPKGWLTIHSPMGELSRSMANILLREVKLVPSLRKDAADLLNALLADKDITIAPYLIRTHILHYGLFGHKFTPRDGIFLSPEDTEKIALESAKNFRQRLLNDDLLGKLWAAQPLYLMVETGIWDDQCRKKLDELLDDPATLVALTLLLFGGYMSTERAWLERLTDVQKYLSRAKAIVAQSDKKGISSSAVNALNKAISGWI